MDKRRGRNTISIAAVYLSQYKYKQFPIRNTVTTLVRMLDSTPLHIVYETLSIVKLISPNQNREECIVHG